jgi:exodeoxyribonuclease V alpha subunit
MKTTKGNAPPAARVAEGGDLDRHFGALMMRLARTDRVELGLAASLASRATANGDVCVHLAEFAGTRVIEAARDVVDASHMNTAQHDEEMPGEVTAPPLAEWTALLRSTSVVGRPGDFRPLILDDHARLYLYRYWDYEQRLAENLIERARAAEGINEGLLREGLVRYFPDERDSEQKLAAAMAMLRNFCVISGGPGTGKTTTVVKILALLAEQAQGRALKIGLAAPTGKAAARVQDAIRAARDRLDLSAEVRARIPDEAYTLHRLLGARPDSIYYRHQRDNPLTLDVLVVDEASMADLALTAKLVEALPRRARLILLGDKDQLESVEAGAVLGDICAGTGVSTDFARRLANVSGLGAKSIGGATPDASPMADSIALLQRSYRFDAESGIGRLARLVNAGDAKGALALLQTGDRTDLAWRTSASRDFAASLSESVLDSMGGYFDAVRAGASPEAVFARFNAFRVLCAHRTGATGVGAVNRIVEDALEARRIINTRETWYAGRPVMISRNDYNLRLFNGDIGIALPDADGRLKVFFIGGEEGVRRFAPARLPEHETVYAMTIHKSQGSEFSRVLMMLPNEPSRIMSRELVYTGITRAMKHVEIRGDEAVFSAAVEHRLVRASGLRDRLWESVAR